MGWLPGTVGSGTDGLLAAGIFNHIPYGGRSGGFLPGRFIIVIIMGTWQELLFCFGRDGGVRLIQFGTAANSNNMAFGRGG